jgi:dTDP-4-dehydrorhamnose reductase
MVKFPTSVAVLGAASWLGYLLIDQLSALPHYQVVGSIYRQQPTFSPTVALFPATSRAAYQAALLKFQPQVVVNFLRGEDDEGFAIHQDIIAYCIANKAHYLYASSALALDAYQNTELTEKLTANSNSPYGVFKANCEKALYESNIDWTILRFSSVQGWVPHKPTRNEIFLKKMFSNEQITVDRGVIQNRMMADVLVAGIVQIIAQGVTGILHFGSTDSSEEYHFLQRVAQLFGYDADMVVAGNTREVNLVTVPSSIFTYLGEKYRLTEQDTLDSLKEIRGLLACAYPNTTQINSKNGI